jgi:transporter family protein
MTWLGWAMLPALFAAVTAVFAKFGVQEVHPNIATAIRTSVVAVLSWTIVAVKPLAGGSIISGRAWLFLLLSGAATGLSWLCYFHALQVGPLARVAPVDKISVVITIVFGARFLGER